MNKFKKTAIVLGSTLVLLVQSGLTVWGADSSHYELKSWKMGTKGDSASITFGFIASDGSSSLVYFALEPSLIKGHETDPSWTGYDSTAPILAYIKKYGIDNNINEAINASYYDPTILKSLKAQGVTLQQLGGPANPQVGKANYPDTIDKLLVGVGIPAPGTTNHTTVSTPQPQENPSPETQSSPQPPAPVSPPKTTQSTQPKQASQSPNVEPKVGTDLNPVPEATKPVEESQADPLRENPPAMAIQDTTPTKLEPTTQEEPKRSPLSFIFAGITGVLIIVAGYFAFWKSKQKKTY